MLNELKEMSLRLRKERNPLAPTMVYHLSEINKIGKNNGNRKTSEEEAIQYVKKTVSKLKEEPTSNPEEISILENILPKMASEQDIIMFLNSIDTNNKGQVMKSIKEKFGILVDMKMVSNILNNKEDKV